jgi:LysM repeat protein
MPIFYTVQHGDTLPSIAKYFGLTLQSLALLNDIPYPYPVYVGQILLIQNKIYPSIIFDNILDYTDVSREYTNTGKSYDEVHNRLDTKIIEKIIGKNGSLQDNVLKFTFPRYDLNVNVEMIPLMPEFALTSWMAFHQVNDNCIVMGDIVLLESEVAPVISQVIANGIEITALHNHLLYELPRIMYMHVSGTGTVVQLAQGIRNVLSVTGTPITGQTSNEVLPMDYWNSVEAIMGKKGNQVGRVIQFSYSRSDMIIEFNRPIPPSMGISHAINFQAEGEYAAVTGDFVLISDEVNPVIRTLKQYGISITAVHNHMLYEDPRLFFLHFWSVDNPDKLAYALKQTLGQTNYIAG